MPKVNRDAIEPYERAVYPGGLVGRTRGYTKLKLSDAGGLSQFGFGEVTLAPGAATGLPHWHVKEDELVYVLGGEVTLVEDGRETILRAGDCACFPAGEAVAHTIENRSDAPARLLELGTRIDDEVAHYPGFDLQFRRAEPPHFFSRQGNPFTDDMTPAPIDERHAHHPRRGD